MFYASVLHWRSTSPRLSAWRPTFLQPLFMYASILCCDLIHTGQDRAVPDHLGTPTHMGTSSREMSKNSGVKTEAVPNGDSSYHLETQSFPNKKNYFLTYCQACCRSSLHLLRCFQSLFGIRVGGGGAGGVVIKVFSTSSNEIVFGSFISVIFWILV